MPRIGAGAMRWTENHRAILIHMWAADRPEFLVARLTSELEIPHASVIYALRRMLFCGYVAQRKGGTNRPFGHEFNGDSSYGTLSNANLWSITDKGKVKASALAAEREGPHGVQ